MYRDLQIPREVPHPDNNMPLDLSNPFEVIIYIVIPVLLIVMYFFLRKKKKHNKNIDQEKNSHD
jgi:preprotein translocase subunit YajC